MHKKTIAIVALATATALTASAVFIVAGVKANAQEDAAAKAVRAANAETLKHMKHWSGYDRLQLKMEATEATEAERQASFSDAAAAGRELGDLSAQWITKTETKKIAPILTKAGVIPSTSAVNDPITYQWSVLSISSVCQSVFDGKTKASDVATVVKATGKQASTEAKLTNAKNAAVQVICPELFPLAQR